MIARLRGEVIEVSGDRVVIEAGGVGYEVLAPQPVLLVNSTIGAPATLYIRQVFREDGQYLYGFQNPDQRALFDLVTDVKGCGPKLGLSLLSELGEHGLANAVVSQDAKMLARASGVGPRLAERINVDLKDKIQEFVVMQKAVVAMGGPQEDEVVDALVALGYRRQEAEFAASDARRDADDVEGQLRAALRSLQR